jgi:hypothetical protein
MMNRPQTILALASKQVWPHVLSLAHYRPDRLVLLHSSEKEESEEPARRLQAFLARTSELGVTVNRAEQIPHDDFAAITRRLDVVYSEQRLEPETAALNFTGGNKLMALAAFEWARGKGLQAFYLERDSKLIQFKFAHGEIQRESPVRLDPSVTNGLDAVDLLTCQLGSAVLQSRGERLRLSERGKKIPLSQISAELRKDVRSGRVDFRKWLEIDPSKKIEERKGDNLEYGVATMLLRLGVPQVYRSVELKPHIYSQLTEGEIDLVFNWNGKLWVVDCKDKVGGSQRLENLKTALVKNDQSLTAYQEQLDSLAQELGEKDIKVLREDILQVSEVGGLLGCAIAVRSASLPKQAKEFADNRRPRVKVALKDELEKRLRHLLFLN